MLARPRCSSFIGLYYVPVDRIVKKHAHTLRCYTFVGRKCWREAGETLCCFVCYVSRVKTPGLQLSISSRSSTAKKEKTATNTLTFGSLKRNSELLTKTERNVPTCRMRTTGTHQEDFFRCLYHSTDLTRLLGAMNILVHTALCR